MFKYKTFFVNGPFVASISSFFRLINIVNNEQMLNITFLPTTGFEPHTCGVRCDRSANSATATALIVLTIQQLLFLLLVVSISIDYANIIPTLVKGDVSR